MYEPKDDIAGDPILLHEPEYYTYTPKRTLKKLLSTMTARRRPVTFCFLFVPAIRHNKRFT